MPKGQIRDIINALGVALAGKPELLVEVKEKIDKIYENKLRGEDRLAAYGEIAALIDFPSEYRHARYLADNIRDITDIAERFIAQKAFAEEANVEEFLGLSISRYCGVDGWIKGTVSKIHVNGYFTFRPDDKSIRATSVDPRYRNKFSLKM